jgi:hypothetical protein
VPTAPNGEARTRSSSGKLTPLAVAVQHHVTHVPDGSQLISVRHQPLGPVSYLHEPDDELSVKAMDLVAGNLVIQADHVRYGTLYSIMAGPSVTEVCLHDDLDQAHEFRQRSAQLQQQHLDVLQELGIDPEDIEQQDAPRGDTGDNDE